MKDFRLGVAQCHPSGSHPFEENLALMERILSRAAQSEVDLLVFPEVFLSGYVDDPNAARARALPLHDPVVRQALSLTRTYAMAVCFGLYETDGDHVFNAAVLADRGRVAGVQRKVHIPARERGFFRPGSGFGVFDLPFARIGIGICYDNEVAETHLSLAVLGAEVILMPAAWSERWERLDYIEPCATEEDVLRERQRWATMMFGARCRDTGTYSALANQCGPVEDGPWRFPGKSLIVAPTGRILAEGAAWKEALLWADLDAAILRRYREMPCYALRGRRPDAYKPLVDESLKGAWSADRRK